MFNLVLVLVPGTQWALCFGQGSQILEKGRKAEKEQGLVNSFSPMLRCTRWFSNVTANSVKPKRLPLNKAADLPEGKEKYCLTPPGWHGKLQASQSFKLPLQNSSFAN